MSARQLFSRSRSRMIGLECTVQVLRASAGEVALLPGAYDLVAVYGGDSVYAAASARFPYAVDPLCLLQVLRLVI